MITQIKWITIAILVILLGGTATAQQKDLNLAHIDSLKKAYAYVQANDYDAAEELYKQIQLEKDVKPDVMQAAAEGEGLVILLALNAFIEKSSESDGFLIRSKQRKIVNQLKKSSSRYPSESLSYMYALVQEQGEISDKTFKGLKLESEYNRLVDKPKEVAVVKEPKPELVKSSGSAIKRSVRAKYTAKNTVNIRKGPGREFIVLDQLQKGDQVTVYESTKLTNGEMWFKLKRNSTFGYVLANFFTKSKPETRTGVVKSAPVKVPKGSGSCSGAVVKAIFVQKGQQVKSSPNGSRLYAYSKSEQVKTYGKINGHFVIRVSQKGKPLKCGYIKLGR